MERRERERLRVKFAVTLSNFQHILVYWSPTSNDIFCRSVPFDEGALFSSTHGRRPLPKDVQRVGVYRAPFCSGDFIDDLIEHIRRAATISA